MRTRYILGLLLTAIPITTCSATDRSFDDIVANSPDGKWKVTARSPYNQSSGYHPWQDEFVYSAFKGQQAKPVWTRHQENQEPYEGSPVRVVVADGGWVVIHTARDQIAFIDPTGRNRGRVDDVKANLPKVDREDFAVESSAGLIWAPYSLWYHLTVAEKRLFVVRLWWGHRIIFDPETGRPVRETAAFDKIADQYEIERTLTMLAQYEREPPEASTAQTILLGAHLAGTLQIADAVPFLRALERSEYIGTTSFRASRVKGGGVDPFSFRKYNIRQVSQLSLRRLGKTPASLPVYEFSRLGRVDEYVRPAAMSEPRDKQVSLVKRKMTVQQVLDLLGSPDFVEGNGWEFDLVGDSPRTVVVQWESGHVLRIIERPPKWKQWAVRDKSIVLF